MGLEKRIGVVGIVVENHKESGSAVQEVLSQYSSYHNRENGYPL